MTYSDPSNPGMWWRDDSPEDTVSTWSDSNSNPIQDLINAADKMREAFAGVSSHVVSVFNIPVRAETDSPVLGTGPYVLAAWDDELAASDDVPTVALCPRHGTPLKGGLCRRCVR